MSYSKRSYRLPTELLPLIDQAAARRGTKPAEWVRQAILTGLRLDGIEPAPEALCALVANGELVCCTLADGSHVITTYWPSETEQGDWVPVQDEGPVIAGSRPAYRLDGDRVVRSYGERA